MRRIAVSVAGLGFAALAGLGMTAALWPSAPSPSAGNPPPSAVAGDPAIPATLLANTGMATVPAASALASPKAARLSYSSAPGGPPVGQLSAGKWGAAPVRPVVQQLPGGWLELRLDSRPNGSTGWVRQKDVTITSTPYRIVISISQRSLTFYQNGIPIYASPVGVGKAWTATPIGPSFVDAVLAVPAAQQYIYGPVVIITASHSNVYTEFDGGDGSVGIHGYPSDPASTLGVASSHGCVRASPQTMATIGHVAVGTPIDILA